MTRTILFLGGGHFMIPAILAGRMMGHRVIVTDMNPEAVGFQYADHHEAVDITDVEKTIDVVKRNRVDAVIPLNDYGVRTAAYITEELGLIGISPDSAELCIDKSKMRRRWLTAGAPCPGFEIVRDRYEAERAAEKIGYPVIAKPPDTMGGSRGVRRINNPEELREAFEYSISFTKGDSILLEEYVEGFECSVESITRNGATHTIGISDKTKLPPPYRVDKSVTYPTFLPEEVQHEIKEVAQHSISALGLTDCASHLELTVTEKGIRLFEIGARTGGGGVLAALQLPATYGVNMMQQTINVLLGEGPDYRGFDTPRGSDFRFLTPPPGEIRSIAGLGSVAKMKGVIAFGCFVKPGDIVKSIQSGSDRVGYVVSKGRSRQDAVAITDEAERTIRFS